VRGVVLAHQGRRSPARAAGDRWIGGNPAAMRVRLRTSRDNRGASETKKSLQEYASASAAVIGRFRSGWEQDALTPHDRHGATAHLRGVRSINPLSIAATRATALTTDRD
jgi:hypothetical protein